MVFQISFPTDGGKDRAVANMKEAQLSRRNSVNRDSVTVYKFCVCVYIHVNVHTHTDIETHTQIVTQYISENDTKSCIKHK